MKRVLVTGAAGFIGANVARRALELGHAVHVAVRLDHPTWRIDEIRREIAVHDLDIADAAAVDRVVREVRPEWIFHLAVHGAYSYQTDLRTITATNVNGTMNLVESCRSIGFEAFVNTGTSSEYGFKDHAPSEDEVVEPNSDYAVTKACATLFCRYTARRYNLRIPTLRLYSAFGPFEEPTRLMPNVVVKGLGGALPPLVHPDIARDYVYTEDILDAYFAAASTPLDDPGSIYNVATGRQTTLREVVEAARELMRIDVEPEWGSMAARAWDTDVWVGDSSRIRRELGWSPRYSFEAGLKRMIDWFEENRELLSFYRSEQSRMQPAR